MIKKIVLFIVCAGLLSTSCQSQKKNDKSKDKKEKNTMINVLDIDFDKDLKELLKKNRFNPSESEFSEYLNAFVTTEVDNFGIGDFILDSKYKVNDMPIPNDSYVSIVTQNPEDTKILAIHIRINSLEKSKAFLESLNKVFGESESLNDENSINALKGKKNHIWKNYKNKYTVILSQFSEGNVINTTDNSSIKVNSALIYLVDKTSIIDYPNGQKEEIIERLIKRFAD